MHTKQSLLIGKLRQYIQEMIAQANKFDALSLEELNWKASESSWSILECLEHLNLYGDFYIPEIEQRILKAPKTLGDCAYKGGWLGNYFANTMWPSDGKIKPIKTFNDKDPRNSNLPKSIIQRFLKQQERFLQLLSMAEEVDMMKTKTGITITSLIKLRLGDTFRFVIAHSQRHIHQANTVWQKMEKASVKA